MGGGTAIFARPALILTEFVAVEEYLRLAEAVLRVFDGCEGTAPQPATRPDSGDGFFHLNPTWVVEGLVYLKAQI